MTRKVLYFTTAYYRSLYKKPKGVPLGSLTHQLLKEEKERNRLKDGYCFFSGLFYPSIRDKNNCYACQLIIIDIDYSTPSKRYLSKESSGDISKELSHLHRFYYHTASSTSSNPTIRVVFGIEAIESKYYESVVRSIVELLEITDDSIEGNIDEGSYEISRLFYYPNNYSDEEALGEIFISDNYTGKTSQWFSHKDVSIIKDTNKVKWIEGSSRYIDPDCSPETVLAAIKYLPTNNRSQWIKIIHSIKSQYPLLSDALPILDAYSDRWASENKKVKNGYDSHKATITAYKGSSPTNIKIATLFHFAIEGGYCPNSVIFDSEAFKRLK